MRLNESYQSTERVTSSTMSILTKPFGHDNDSLIIFSQTKNTFLLLSDVASSALLLFLICRRQAIVLWLVSTYWPHRAIRGEKRSYPSILSLSLTRRLELCAPSSSAQYTYTQLKAPYQTKASFSWECSSQKRDKIINHQPLRRLWMDLLRNTFAHEWQENNRT